VKEKVLFVGQGKTFQMWEPSQFKKFSDDARKKSKITKIKPKMEY